MRKVFEFESQSTGEIITVLAVDKVSALEEFYKVLPDDPYPEFLNEWSLESYVTLTSQPEKWLANIKLHERFFIFAVKVFNWIADRDWRDA